MDKLTSDNSEKKEKDTFLGMSPDSFAEVKSEEVVNNLTAVKMILHYYKKLTEDNQTYKNDLNTYKTYADAFSKKQSNSATSAILLILSNVLIAFGVNFLTSNPPINVGWFLLISGGLSTLAGLYFNFWKDKH
jgi:hypothetical protein